MGLKPENFSVPLSKIDYYQNLVDERQKKIEEELEKERERERKERKYSNDSDSESDNEKKYQRNNFMNKEKDYIKVCQNCNWVCFLCRRNFKNENYKIITQVYARVHLKCLNSTSNKVICPLCRDKLRNNYTNYICAKCKSKISSFRCYLCNKYF